MTRKYWNLRRSVKKQICYLQLQLDTHLGPEQLSTDVKVITMETHLVSVEAKELG